MTSIDNAFHTEGENNTDTSIGITTSDITDRRYFLSKADNDNYFGVHVVLGDADTPEWWNKMGMHSLHR